MKWLLVCAVWLIAAAAPTLAAGPSERVIAALSQNAVGITADFTGSEIFVFGAIARDRLPDATDDALNIIIAVTGPKTNTTLHKKNRTFGLWINTESVNVNDAPSFYAIATTGPLESILSHTEDLRYRISIEQAVRLVGAAGKVAEPDEFREAIIRINRAAGVYFENIGDVELTERTLFQSHFELPSNIVEGDYQARVYLLREGAVLDTFSTTIEVRKVGFERWIYELAHEQSLLYGLLSILVALIAGWGASEAFRLLRR
ncbi:TIGR02186 family protein [Pikeienuella sp. HZG-20]|uniref:TIGR02186 family protein n=1 Tax=Paludibacillus litoralis TaxID=3133267 RepID=UPI0030ED319B